MTIGEQESLETFGCQVEMYNIKMILKASPITFVCLEDGSETTVSSALLSSARRSCRYSCEGASLANVYYALKAVTEGEFKCKCVDTSFTSIIAEEGQYSSSNLIITFFIQLFSHFS